MYEGELESRNPFDADAVEGPAPIDAPTITSSELG